MCLFFGQKISITWQRNLDYDKAYFDIYITDSNSSDGTIDAINELNYNINIVNIGKDKYWFTFIEYFSLASISNFSFFIKSSPVSSLFSLKISVVIKYASFPIHTLSGYSSSIICSHTS